MNMTLDGRLNIQTRSLDDQNALRSRGIVVYISFRVCSLYLIYFYSSGSSEDLLGLKTSISYDASSPLAMVHMKPSLSAGNIPRSSTGL